MNLVDFIGEPALLEQLAEECNELSHASLKLARMIRGENKVHGKTKEELIDNIHEEIADVSITIDELSKCTNVVDSVEIIKWYNNKRERMEKRLEEVRKED